MTTKIEKEFNNLMIKYGFNLNIPLLEDRLKKYINEIIETRIPVGARVAIRGNGGSHASELIKIINGKRNIVGIFDKDPNVDFVENIPVYDSQELAKFNIDTIIIGSLGKSKEINFELSESYDKNSIINVYDIILIEYGFIFNKPFYEYYEEEDLNHLSNIEAYHRYVNAKDRKTKEKEFNNFIYRLLLNKDFVEVEHFIKEYQKLGKNETGYYTNLINDLNELYDLINNELKKQNKKNIIMHWIDQVCYDEFKYFNYLNTMKDKSLFFDSIFTVTPYTKPTIRSMFFREVLGENGNFGKNTDCSESFIIQELEKNGYEFVYIGINKAVKVFERYHIPSDYNEPFSLRYWKLLNKLMISDKPLFVIVHCVVETHDPYLSPEIEKMQICYGFHCNYKSKLTQLQIEQSNKYTDRVIEFYTEKFLKNNINIFMSDHGKWKYIDDRRYYDKASRVWLMIVGLANIKNKIEKRLVTYLDFDKIIMYILNPVASNYEDLFNEYVLLSDSKIYNHEHLTILESKGVNCNNSEIVLGYEGIRSEYDKYIRFENGNEYYCILPDDTLNQINNCNNQPRITELRRCLYEYKKSM